MVRHDRLCVGAAGSMCFPLPYVKALALTSPPPYSSSGHHKGIFRRRKDRNRYTRSNHGHAAPPVTDGALVLHFRS